MSNQIGSRKNSDHSTWRLIMKTVISAVLALGVLAGVAGTASAADFDVKKFFENIERNAG